MGAEGSSALSDAPPLSRPRADTSPRGLLAWPTGSGGCVWMLKPHQLEPVSLTLVRSQRWRRRACESKVVWLI